MNEVEFIESLGTLEVKEGDIIVIKCKQRISTEAAKRIADIVQERLPSNIKSTVRVFVLDDGMDIGVLRGEKRSAADD